MHKGGRKAPAPRVQPAAAPVAPVPSGLPGWVKIGVVLLFVVACAWGVLEVHFSTDTWIGLAAGRQILSEPQFPKNDTFSYTFCGQMWFNQNWLTHVFLWVLYHWIGPDAVIIGTWAIGYGIFTLVLLATRLRCGSWLAATIAASMVAIASRDWLSARPATFQFFFFAALWLCLSALISQGERRRWWPVALLLPVFAAWTHAHGSFVFGYVLVAMFLGTAVVARLLRQPATVSLPQWIAIAVIALVTAVMGAVLSPYGLENYTHPLKVAESPVFRNVGEWFPPYLEASFPPVLRFWIAFAVAAASPLIALFLRLPASPVSAGPRGAPSESPARRGAGLHIALFDVAAVVMGLCMAMWARRFAPLFHILAAPVLTRWLLQLAGPLSVRFRGRLKDAAVLAAWPTLAATAYFTVSRTYAELWVQFAPDQHYNLLDRVTRMDASPRDSIEFLRRNHLSANVLAEWTQAGPIMFYCSPGVRVFIDGRSQQVYSEQHYLALRWLMNLTDAEEPQLSGVLERYGTDAVLLRAIPSVSRLINALGRQPQWVLATASPSEVLFVRRGSTLLDELARRERVGDLWWPGSAEAESARGFLVLNTEPRDAGRALSLWKSAVARQPALGVQCYWWITSTLLREGRAEEAAAYLQSEKVRLSAPRAGLNEQQRAKSLQELERAEGLLGRQRGVRGPG